MSKKISKAENNKEVQLSINELLIDFAKDKTTPPEKYNKLVIAMKWAYHLKNTEEYKNKPSSEIIEKALIDVFSGTITQNIVDSACEKDEQIRLERIAERKKTKSTDE
ncbi:MAG: hypothetical protein N2Z20_03835 [Elusimicrobiales bacterium]|nr:hypothetical protein [Elusimicrobiales bacterium]